MSRVRAGVFNPQDTQLTTTQDPIHSHLSFIGVPNSAQDLEDDQYALVLRSIEQDLRTSLARHAPAPPHVAFAQLMHADAPKEPRDVLQALVYVARIKDIANTRGGAQVSQHRRVLAQQTYKMLVQELGDVLQSTAVQSKLRDMSTRTHLQRQAQAAKVPGVINKRDTPNTSMKTEAGTHSNQTTETPQIVSSVVQEVVLDLIETLEMEDEPDALTSQLQALRTRFENEVKAKEKRIDELGKKLSNLNDNEMASEASKDLENSTETLRKINEAKINYEDYVKPCNLRLTYLAQALSRARQEKDDTKVRELDHEIQKVNGLLKIQIQHTIRYLDYLNTEPQHQKRGTNKEQADN